MRLLSSCWPGLKSSEGLVEAGEGAPKLIHVVVGRGLQSLGMQAPQAVCSVAGASSTEGPRAGE